ncbi:MAG: hypothetical protein Q9219_000807 [cf. Caloplaca sp. 3 TL-2023]
MHANSRQRLRRIETRLFAAPVAEPHVRCDRKRHVLPIKMRIAPYASEYELFLSKRQSAKDAIIEIYHRQRAFSLSKPASTIALGTGSTFLYRQGVLAYVRSKLVRILDIHEASRTEGVVLTNRIGPEILGTDYKDTEVELCNLQDGLLSILFHGEARNFGWRSWLLVLNVSQYRTMQERVRLAVDLWTSDDIILRNDGQFVCALTPSGVSANGRHREWVSRIWNLGNFASRPTVLQIPDLAVGEIGQGLVFEVYNGFLYAISTQAPYELEEPEWMSYYTCVRIPLQQPESSTIESLRIWRRHHKEGPINDLWTDLKLHRDEQTDELFIIEARKEWTGGSSTQERTWYRQILPSQFPRPKGSIDEDQEMADPSNQSNNLQQISTVNQSQNLASENASDQDPPYLHATPPDDDESDGIFSSSGTSLNQRPCHPRLPCDTHPEYTVDAPAPPIVDSFILAKSKYRTYNPSAAAFLDLVVDDRRPSTRNDWAQQIRFRIGSRREASPLDQNGMVHRHHINVHNRRPVHDSEKRYVNQGIHLWPPAESPVALLNLLNGRFIPSESSSAGAGCKTVGNISAVSDERSIVYLVKDKGVTEDDNGQLILVNFDEHVHFFHDEWIPEFIDLYGHQRPYRNDSSNQPAEQIIVEGMLKRTSEPMALDDEVAREDGNKDEETREEESNDGDDVDRIIPADDINDYFWCELYDEDEPLDLDWFSVEMAQWTNIEEGFCFV